MNKSAKNMEAIVAAKVVHNETCPWGGEAKRVRMHPFDIERMGWEDGDVIASLVLVSDTAITTGMLKVECDAEPDSDGPTLDETVKQEDVVYA